MSKKANKFWRRRINGPRKTKLKLGVRVPLIFAAVSLLAGTVAIWLNVKFEKAENDYLAYRAHHPYRQGERSFKPTFTIDW